MKKSILALIGLFLVGLVISPAGAAPEGEVSKARELARESHQAAYFPGDDVRWKAKMKITDKNGNVRTRTLSILRKDVGEGKQKYYSYFHNPPQLERMVFLVWTNPGADDDRWLYMPAVDLVQRITGSQKRNSFAGSNFTYEDMTGRYPGQDTFTYVGTGHVNGDTVEIIEGHPKQPEMVEFSYYRAYIDQETKLPLKGEFYTPQGKLGRTLTLEETKVIDGHPTPVKQKAVNHQTGSTTVAKMSEIEYDIGIPERVFSKRYLRRPPTPWIKP